MDIKFDPKSIKYNTNINEQIVISPRQRRNPVLRFVKAVPYVEGDIEADFMISKNVSVLFLSLKYHRVNSNYISERLESIPKSRTKNLFLLCQVDVPEYAQFLLDILMSTFTHGCKMILSWSIPESATILEILKLNWFRGIETLNRKQMRTHNESVANLLLNVKCVNNNDVYKFRTRFKSLKDIFHFEPSELQGIRGMGRKKLESLSAAFNNDFY